MPERKLIFLQNCYTKKFVGIVFLVIILPSRNLSADRRTVPFSSRLERLVRLHHVGGTDLQKGQTDNKISGMSDWNLLNILPFFVLF
jgi:hypothetical protein